MQFSLSFLVHFVFSLLGFLALGIFICRGSWRNRIRHSWLLAAALISAGHIVGTHKYLGVMASAIAAGILVALYVFMLSRPGFVPSEVRGGHNAFSLIVGAALFGLAVQLHYAVTGVSVFELVK